LVFYLKSSPAGSGRG